MAHGEVTMVAGKNASDSYLGGHCNLRQAPEKNICGSGPRQAVFSTLAHARAATIATADAAADGRHETSPGRAYVTLGLKELARISNGLSPHLYTTQPGRNH